MAIFKSGLFKLHSGQITSFKISLDTLTQEDWETLAAIAGSMLPPFGSVEGVPTGGLAFAEALRPYITTGSLLIVDDVLTTGSSMEEVRSGRKANGVVVFSRAALCPGWITPLFTLTKGNI